MMRGPLNSGDCERQSPWFADPTGIREGGRVLFTEILLPRTARQGAVCLISIRGQAVFLYYEYVLLKLLIY